MGVLSGQVALVTGASKGIEADIANGLAEQRAVVVVNHASSKEGADRVVTEIASEAQCLLAAEHLSDSIQHC